VRPPDTPHDSAARLRRLEGAPVRVLIVEDHPLYAEALMLALIASERIDVCGHAKDGREAVERAALLEPDIVLMDVGLPVLDGIEATRLVRRCSPHTRVIVHTSDDAGATRAAAFAAGASAFVTKTCTAQELVDTVHAVASQVLPFRRPAVGAA